MIGDFQQVRVGRQQGLEPAARQDQHAFAPRPTRARRYQCGCWRVVEAAGELDISAVSTLRCLLRGNPAHVVFDMRRVTFIDASVLGVLVATRNNQGLTHGAVRLAGPSKQLSRMIAITGLDAVLSLHSFDEAFSGHDSC